jgi:hypothetical protein
MVGWIVESLAGRGPSAVLGVGLPWETLREGEGVIRVKLFAPTGSVHLAEFGAIPLKEEKDFRCVPEGCLSFDTAVLLSYEMQAGQVHGRISGCKWYRQAGDAKDEPSTNTIGASRGSGRRSPV